MSKYSDEDRQALIDLIRWYRDDYHQADFGHTEYMQAIRDGAELEPYYRLVDGWLDS